ncbi:MAG: MBOAT family O-acyltransferase [Microcoleaceae cyanobacterium]
MTFISSAYGLFLLILLGIYWLIPLQNGRLLVLLVASLLFYSTLQVHYIPFLLLCVLFNFGLAIAIGEPLDWRVTNRSWHRRRSLLLALGIIVNIGLLLGFKYIPFILTTVGTVNQDPAMIDQADWFSDTIIAPFGLSFFCFELVAYLIDVYRGAPATTSLLSFTSYKFFFPKLISGPITRFHHLDKQFKSLQFPAANQIADGLWLMARGTVKKGLLADNLGILVDLSFSNLERAGSGDIWLATVAYGLQLYLDFSGYVDLARGTAMLLGLNLPENFDAPYFSTSIADFWRRWHITLGDWLRNYLYFPLGGSRVDLPRTCLNLMIVMLVAGIWHGAAWGFVVWGILHGIALVIHRLTDAASKRWSFEWIWQTLPGVLSAWLITQLMVFSAWIFFRLPNLKDASLALQHLWGQQSDVQFAHKVYVESLGLERVHIVILLGLIFVAMGISTLLNRGLKLQFNWPVKLLFVPLCFFVVWVLAPEGSLPYIYFDF